MVEFDEVVPRGQVGVVGDALGAAKGGEGNVPALALVKDFLHRVAPGEFGDEEIQQFPVLDAPGGGALEEGVEHFLVAGFLVDPLGQGLPMRRPVDHQVDAAVRARIRARGHRGRQAGAHPARDDSVVQPLAHPRDVGDGQGRFLERNVHVLALARPSGAEQGHHAGRGRERAGHEELLLARQGDRGIFGIPRHVEGAAHRPGHQVRGFPAGPGARLPEARDGGHHGGRVRGGQGWIADPQVLEFAGGQGFEHDVGAQGEFAQNRAALGAANVQGHAALARVQVEEMETAVRPGFVAQEGRDRPRLAAARWLHLDHVGAHVGQQFPAVRTAFVGDLENPPARQ